MLPLAEAVTKVIGRANHFAGLAKNIAKTSLPPRLVPVAQAFVEDLTPDGFSDFQIAYGLAFLLAKEGSKKSWRIVEAFAERAIEAAKGDTVVNPAELFARYLPKSPLREKLARIEEERVSVSEAHALGKKLKLPVDDGWSATIWIGKGIPNGWFGAMQDAPQLHLVLEPANKPDWKMDARGKNGDGIYSNWGGEITQDDFGLPKLARLEDVPTWIPLAGKKLKVAFSIDDASIKVGRKKKAADPIRKWLRG